MKTNLLLIFFVFFNTVIYSQNQFESGYFIDSLGQKTECLILNKGWKDNPSQFSYKLSVNDEPKTLTIKQVVEFGINDQIKFIKFNVLMDKSSDQISYLSNTRKAEYTKSQLFLQVLVEGKTSLYSYRKINLIRYFYSTDTIQIEQLVYKLYRVDGDKNILENNKFRYQLKFNLPCDASTDLITENIAYKKKELIDYFVKYNSCKNELYTVFSPLKNRGLFHLNIRLGVQFSSLSVANNFTHFYDVTFENEVGFRIGVETEFILPFNNNKWAILTEPTYQYFSSEKQIPSQLVKIDYQSIEFPISLRHYFYLNKESKLFINGSIIFDFPIKSTITWESYPDHDLEISNNLAFGIGYKHDKKLGIEVRYGFKRNILNRYLNWGANYQTLSLIASYSLW